jgi:hypothetical protein
VITDGCVELTHALLQFPILATFQTDVRNSMDLSCAIAKIMMGHHIEPNPGIGVNFVFAVWQETNSFSK